jgi:Tfp pilus assembly protein PilF
VSAPSDPYNPARETLASGDAAAAAERFREAFVRHPHRFDYHYKRGLKLLRKGEMDAAIDHMRQAVAINPKFADLYNYLGVALVESGKEEEGEAAFRRSVALNPDYMVAHLNLGFTLAQMSRRPEAVEQLKFVLEKDPENQAVLSKLAEMEMDEQPSRKSGEGAAHHER